MSSQSGSGDRTKSLGVRRPVEVPEADMEGAADLAPASGAASVDEPGPASAPASAEEQTPADGSASESENDRSAAAGGESTDAGAGGSADESSEGSGDAQTPAASPDEATEPAADEKAGKKDDKAAEKDEAAGPAADGKAAKEDDKAAKKEKRTAWLRNVAVAPAASDGATAAGDEMPPDRPRKPVLAAVAIGGVVLLSIPILLVGTGSHDGKKQRTTAAADRVMAGGGQAAAGAYVSTSPTPTTSASASATPKKGTKAGEATSKATTAAGKHEADTGKGQVGVLRNGRGPTGPKFSTVTRVLLHNTMTGLCADVPGYGNGSIEGPINQFTCTRSNSDNQLWDLVVNMKGGGPHGADLFTIRNSKDNYCFDLPGAGPAPARTSLSENLCYPGLSDNQMWYLDERSSGHFWIRNYVSHKLCLDVSGYYGSGGKDARLTLFPCDPKDDHIWSFG
ncbi:RICIN domain-containing protein [Actinoallomurus sp. CA-150999]|uniref:RICIN domain-containing protein n=1 Tax=Actinoallomurus sp. CA-150999 TaxID=3239887 RepID=UPI003D8FE80C